MTGLDRPVRDLLNGRLVHVAPTATLRSAAVELDNELVGALMVRTVAGTYGIFTERDIVRALADGADPDDARVADYLTDDLMTVEPSTPLLDVLTRMRMNALRHVVVLEDEQVKGVVSMRAVVEAALQAGAKVA